jgi:hypothetical protein
MDVINMKPTMFGNYRGEDPHEVPTFDVVILVITDRSWLPQDLLSFNCTNPVS